MALNGIERKKGFASSRKKTRVLIVDSRGDRSERSSSSHFFLSIRLPSPKIFPSESSGKRTPGDLIDLKKDLAWWTYMN